jgi:hypothetical protein
MHICYTCSIGTGHGGKEHLYTPDVRPALLVVLSRFTRGVLLAPLTTSS